jgi:STAS-like domain of unknown function (DUF4325)
MSGRLRRLIVMTTLERNSAQSSASPRYVLGRHGHAFSTRTRAEQIRGEIEQLASGASEVLIDFEGVASVSYSFADELVGVMAAHHIADSRQPRPVVIGLSAQAQRVLLGSLTQRGVSEDASRQLVPH